MQRTAGGAVLAGALEVYEKREPATVALSLKRTQELIGTPLTRQEVVDSLASIGIKEGATPQANGETLFFSIPSFRHDITEYVDLVEEVARLAGYDRVPATAPVSPLLPVSLTKLDADIGAVREYLTAAGFYEVINYAFFSVKDIENFSHRAARRARRVRAHAQPHIEGAGRHAHVPRRAPARKYRLQQQQGRKEPAALRGRQGILQSGGVGAAPGVDASRGRHFRQGEGILLEGRGARLPISST